MIRLYRYLIGGCIILMNALSIAQAAATNTSQALELLTLAAGQPLPWQQYVFKQPLAEALSSPDQGRNKLLIRGHNPNAGSLLLVVRLDDEQSQDYHSRVNIERQVGQGDFEWSFDLNALRCANGRLLSLTGLKRVMVFYGQPPDAGQQPVRLKRVVISAVSELVSRSGEQGMAYDFGSPDSAVLDGARALTPASSNPQLQLLGQLRTVERPGPDPWLKDGIAGIEQLEIGITAAMRQRSRFWQLSLFREDVGEWENLPRQLNMAIEVQGRQLDWAVAGQPSQAVASNWYQQHYLRFYRQPALTDPWQDIVSKRGALQSFTLDLEELLSTTGAAADTLSLRLLGDTPGERFVAGLVFEPLTGARPHLLQGINRLRERYFKRHWHSRYSLPQEVVQAGQRNPHWVARDQAFVVGFFHHFNQPGEVSLASHVPGFNVELRYGQPGWYRDGSHYRLQRDIRHLTALKPGQLLQGDVLVMAFFYPSGQPRQQHRQAAYELKFDSAADTLFSHRINLLDDDLGSGHRAVGIYLDDNPALNWFRELKPFVLAQTYCDLKFLARTGLQALAPPLVTPTQNRLQHWQRQLALYRRFYPQQALLAYTPYKRLKQWLPGEALTRQLSRVAAAEQVFWSVADEVAQDELSQVEQDVRRLQSANQSAKAAGQLNHPQQKVLLETLDLIIINHGFGVSLAQTQAIQRRYNKPLWFYNMPSMRHAAGLLLWLSNADAYVQWHGRMPSADPYDPTDGREADYQFFPPEPRPCGAIPDIDRRLFDLLAGLNDQRWLNWLSRRKDAAAIALQQRIRQQAGDHWQTIAAVSETTLADWRADIATLARSLKQSNKASVLVLQNAKPTAWTQDTAEKPDPASQPPAGAQHPVSVNRPAAGRLRNKNDG